ncbi:hypothetical protein NC652_019256 [Populus alba x Populus x berolinensis]|uniref:Uncharacterized protein n=1 Tax=Populus tomentosa TaxID=118781 RepID=A0A8X7ZGJ2_POPTO|nr:hypothetical protein POTOM_027255 [Populus tomentosa]KAJ6916781.1 hypothetical protein NC652_019256 [Populus alba x Populus x berolinensis]
MSQATSQSNQQDAENLRKNANENSQNATSQSDKHGNTYLNYFNRYNHSFQADDIPQALESLTIASDF